MNRKLTQEEFDSLWYLPYTRIWKDPRHFKIVPTKEILFEGPFYAARVAILTLENVCNSKAAYIIESSSPDLFYITPRIAVVKKGAVVKVRICMYPNVANEALAIHTFKLSSIVVVERVKLSLISRRWMDLQPHNIYEESWTCKFEQPIKPGDLTAFYDCLHLPLPPPSPPKRRIPAVAKVIQKTNQQLSFKIRTLRDENAHRLQMLAKPKIRKYVRPSVAMEDGLEGIFRIFGMNVHNLMVSDVRFAIVIFEITLFLTGVLIGVIIF